MLDPDLGSRMDEARRQAAIRGVEVKVEHHLQGLWNTSDSAMVETGFGYLLIRGFLIREIQLDGRSAVELLGPGDLTKPWQEIDIGVGVGVTDSWSWLTPGTVAVLDRRHFSGPGAFPEIVEVLLDREISRSRWLGLHLAACHLPRVDHRLMVTFGYLANRWGKVGSNGVKIPVPVNHQMLAGIVAARRPSVTLAIGELRSNGIITREDDGSWLADRQILDSISMLAKPEESEPE